MGVILLVLRELEKSIEDMHHSKIQRFMLKMQSGLCGIEIPPLKATWVESGRDKLGLLEASFHLFSQQQFG